MNEKQDIRYDEFGEEILYEIRHNVFILDWISYILIFLVSLFILIVFPIMISKIFADENPILVLIAVFYSPKSWLIFLLYIAIFYSVIDAYRQVFYYRKNKIYITNQGIGFERRNWFRIQKGFFRFGEVGLVKYYTPRPFLERSNCFVYYFLNHQAPSKNYRYFNLIFMPKHYHKVFLCDEYMTNQEREKLLNFIRQKTKEALEFQGITISDAELKDKIKDLGYKDI
ncbi:MULTISPECIES: hypothetical protein [Helicobacter]|uniref:hypothetical protein n=1 Tax=Helicobacter TaxID=209 RepID=UPI00051CCAC5|nr:hypothetical protein [Helicobacter sp. MIT 03-1616]TLD88725.1 hypothetical protein LS67_003605 [Helicobacter sp. MIT 03-1616]